MSTNNLKIKILYIYIYIYLTGLEAVTSSKKAITPILMKDLTEKGELSLSFFTGEKKVPKIKTKNSKQDGSGSGLMIGLIHAAD